jgi:hypothetical protein
MIPVLQLCCYVALACYTAALCTDTVTNYDYYCFDAVNTTGSAYRSCKRGHLLIICTDERLHSYILDTGDARFFLIHVPVVQPLVYYYYKTHAIKVRVYTEPCASAMHASSSIVYRCLHR